MKVNLYATYCMTGYKLVGEEEVPVLELRVCYTGLLSMAFMPPAGMKLWLGNRDTQPLIVDRIEGIACNLSKAPGNNISVVEYDCFATYHDSVVFSEHESDVSEESFRADLVQGLRDRNHEFDDVGLVIPEHGTIEIGLWDQSGNPVRSPEKIKSANFPWRVS